MLVIQWWRQKEETQKTENKKESENLKMIQKHMPHENPHNHEEIDQEIARTALSLDYLLRESPRHVTLRGGRILETRREVRDAISGTR